MMKNYLSIGNIILFLCFCIALPAVAKLPAVGLPDVCFECHSELDATSRGQHVHTAFADGDCASCHNPHASKHEGLLVDDTRLLCLKCHEEMNATVDFVAPHQPVAIGDCASCHDPHASNQPNQLKMPLSENCATCHPASIEWSVQAVVHKPVTEGGCLECHAVHGSDVAGILSATVPGLCFACHEEDDSFRNAHGGRSIVDSDCTACHDPHSSNEKGLLRANRHEPFATDNCVKCHPDLDAGGTFSIAGSTTSGGVQPTKQPSATRPSMRIIIGRYAVP